MLLESGAIRICTTKSILKNRLAVRSTARNATTGVSDIVLDSPAASWAVRLPAKGTIKDFVKTSWDF